MAQVAALRVREKAHTREGDAIAAARRRLPMVEVDPATLVIGKNGPNGPKSNSYRLMEDGSTPPSGKEGRPTPQWARLAAGHREDLVSTIEAPLDEHCCHGD